MKTLVTAIQKGGQGKTFATCHLAFDFLERGLRVAVIDLDTQGNASFTLSAYQSGYLASQLFTGDTDDLRYWFGKREGESEAQHVSEKTVAPRHGRVRALLHRSGRLRLRASSSTARRTARCTQRAGIRSANTGQCSSRARNARGRVP